MPVFSCLQVRFDGQSVTASLQSPTPSARNGYVPRNWKKLRLRLISSSPNFTARRLDSYLESKAMRTQARFQPNYVKTEKTASERGSFQRFSALPRWTSEFIFGT